VIRQPSTWGVHLSELALLTVAGHTWPSSHEPDTDGARTVEVIEQHD
jgi:hypothetical protein